MTSTTVYETSLEASVAFKRLTGTTCRLTPFEALVKIAVKSDDEIIVQITTYEVIERRTEYVIKNRGTKLVGFSNRHGTWQQNGKALVVWETDFEPFSIPFYGSGKTMAEWLDAKEFARMCHRPGSSAVPMDSHKRVMQGASTVRMTRHW